MPCLRRGQGLREDAAQPRSAQASHSGGSPEPPRAYARLSPAVVPANSGPTLQWLTSHKPSTEHDLTGLREHFDPRARWRAAIAGARALHRFTSGSSRTASGSGSSGGWRTGSFVDSDDDDEDEHPRPSAAVAPETHARDAAGSAHEETHSESEYVKVTAPEEDEPEHQKPKHEAEPCAPKPPSEPVSTPPPQPSPAPAPAQTQEAATQSAQPAESGRVTPELKMPGSFDVPEDQYHHNHHHAWEGGLMGLFKKMHIRQ